MPLTRDYIDWVVNESDQLTVALDAIEDTCIILVATRGEDSESCAARLAKIGAELCRDYDAHTVFWNGSTTPISAEEFLSADILSDVDELAAARVKPRRVVRQAAHGRAIRKPNGAQLDQWLLKAVRAQLMSTDPHELEQMELDERRAKTVPLRLAAWALSISTALIAAPLAIPLLVHNLVRGEDLRSGAMALGVAGLYATMAQTGMVPGLSALL
jgi:hypothetical protein